jgi:ApaG protein
VQLLNRYWHITDANNNIQEVQGEGVIGKQPRIGVGESFQYSSGAILETPAGMMHGHYEFITDNKELFNADIPAFSLVDPRNLH